MENLNTKIVIPLAAISSSIKVNDNVIPVDAQILFHRMYIGKQSDEELQEYFQYDLPPHPLSVLQGGNSKRHKIFLY